MLLCCSVHLFTPLWWGGGKGIIIYHEKALPSGVCRDQ